MSTCALSSLPLRLSGTSLVLDTGELDSAAQHPRALRLAQRELPERLLPAKFSPEQAAAPERWPMRSLNVAHLDAT